MGFRFPTIETERLLLRKPTLTDAGALFALRANKSVNQYLDGFQHNTIEQTQQFLRDLIAGLDAGKSPYWMMMLKESPVFVGTICIWNVHSIAQKAEVGYVLHPDYQGSGYMHEAMEQVLNHARYHMGLHTIEAYTHKYNARSIKLLDKNGFVLDPTQMPVEKDNVVYALQLRAL
jgi:[ribosomal protein S5]-alanine N-acetyltransferase